MKKINITVIIIFIGALFAFNNANAQADKTINIVTKYMKYPYISDGQQYKALLNGDEIAEFHITFFGGTTYRIAAAAGTEEGNVIFRVYDKQRNLLFTNADYNNSPYWDFKFTSTVDCLIEIQLDNTNIQSGFMYMLVGFKQQ